MLPPKKKAPPLTQQELNKILRQHRAYVKLQGGLRAQLKHAILDGLNLANEDLSEADLAGASLVGATLYGSNLHRASLYCADLTDCDLRQSKLIRTDMRGAALRGARLNNAIMDHADLRSGRMMIVAPGGAASIHGDGRPMSVDFSDCSLRGASFGNAKLDGANFSGAILRGANFKGAEIKNARFTNAVLTGVNLSDLHVPSEQLVDSIRDASPDAFAKANALKAALEAHQRWIAGQGRDGQPAVLDGRDLRPLHQSFANRRLGGLSARNAMAIEIDFSGSELQAAKFDGADLRGANFSRSNLRGASFKGAKLFHANFDGANLGSLPLANGTFLAANFEGAEMLERQLDGTVRETGPTAQSDIPNSAV